MEITIETTRVFIAGGESSQRRAWCERCGARAHLVTVEQAATGAALTACSNQFKSAHLAVLSNRQ
jgi:hypothetical protein